MRLAIANLLIQTASILFTIVIVVQVEGAPAPPARPQVLIETSLAATPVTGKTIRPRRFLT